MTLPAPAVAATAIITSSSEFNQKFPDTIRENFNDGLATEGNAVACTGPISSGADSLCFAKGALPKGVTFVNKPQGGSGVVHAAANWDSNPSGQIFANAFADTFVMTFTKPVTVVGFNLVSHFNDATCQVTVSYADGSTPLVTSGACTKAGTNFIGFRSDKPIASVEVGVAGNSEGIDNLRFGQASPKVAIKKVANNLNNGTAVASVSVNGPGKVSLTGKKVKPQSRVVQQGKVVKLKVARKNPVQGESKVKVKVTFNPVTGPTVTKKKTITLINR